MPPTAFASSEPLAEDELRAVGPPRYPRPSRLQTPLEVKPDKAATAAERMGLLTIGDLLDHLPRDRQSSRTIAELASTRWRRSSWRCARSRRARCAAAG